MIKTHKEYVINIYFSHEKTTESLIHSTANITRCSLTIYEKEL